MNISEANDVNVVLRHLLSLSDRSGSTPAPSDALEAAQRLADRSRKALGAGLDGSDVADAWPKPSAAAELAEILGFTLHPWQRRVMDRMLDPAGGPLAVAHPRVPARGTTPALVILDEAHALEGDVVDESCGPLLPTAAWEACNPALPEGRKA